MIHFQVARVKNDGYNHNCSFYQGRDDSSSSAHVRAPRLRPRSCFAASLDSAPHARIRSRRHLWLPQFLSHSPSLQSFPSCSRLRQHRRHSRLAATPPFQYISSSIEPTNRCSRAFQGFPLILVVHIANFEFSSNCCRWRRRRNSPKLKHSDDQYLLLLGVNLAYIMEQHLEASFLVIFSFAGSIFLFPSPSSSVPDSPPWSSPLRPSPSVRAETTCRAQRTRGEAPRSNISLYLAFYCAYDVAEVGKIFTGRALITSSHQEPFKWARVNPVFVFIFSLAISL
jgi:hypothetical protein